MEEKHIKKEIELTCQKCGKKFTIKVSEYCFQKGKFRKFCCRSCANSRIFSEERNKLVSEKLKRYYNICSDGFPRKSFKIYTCKNCGKEFTMIDDRDTKSRTYCSIECMKKWTRENVYSKSGGYRKGSGRGKHGWYKGIHCDSTYELAYLIYCLDHNINIKRSDKIYEYQIGSKVHYYHPDFEVNDELVEIKGYHTDLVDIKLSSVKDPIKILYKKDLQYCFDYILKKYGKNKDHIKELYDDYKPIYEYTCSYCNKTFTKDKKINTIHKFCCRQCAGKYTKINNLKRK